MRVRHIRARSIWPRPLAAIVRGAWALLAGLNRKLQIASPNRCKPAEFINANANAVAAELTWSERTAALGPNQTPAALAMASSARSDARPLRASERAIDARGQKSHRSDRIGSAAEIRHKDCSVAHASDTISAYLGTASARCARSRTDLRADRRRQISDYGASQKRAKAVASLSSLSECCRRCCVWLRRRISKSPDR